MAQPRVYRTEAIVLRQRPLAEADKVCVLFTPLHGRIEAVAKGVRRSRSRLAGHVEPLTRSRFLIARTRSLDIITQAETVDAFPALHAELDRLGLALCAAELVDRFTDTAADVGALYRLLLDTLGRLESGPCPRPRPALVRAAPARRPGLPPPAWPLRALRRRAAGRGRGLRRRGRRRRLPRLPHRHRRPPPIPTGLQVVKVYAVCAL